MTANEAGWHIESFNSKAHGRANFRCGEPELDQYFRKFASQDMRRDVAKVFVAVSVVSGDVSGYYSLSAASFQRDALPAAAAKNLPRYPVPAVLLGRLAVDEAQQKCGLGEYMLMDAINRTCLANEVLAMYAMVVTAINESAATFYEKYGFLRFVDNKLRLFLPMETIRNLVNT